MLQERAAIRWRDGTFHAAKHPRRRFDRRFSRFIDGSEANAFRDASVGTYSISEEFATVLARADDLRRLTYGRYDPAVGGLLEKAGYDPFYRMTARPDVAEFTLPRWTIAGRELTIDGPVVFDIGGMGKGYCIDKVAVLLGSNGFEHYLVDGGGDMYGTSKSDGSPWAIALEYPGKSDMAVGSVALKDRGVAVSDGFRRRWGDWHHLIDPIKKKPVQSVVGAIAVGRSAWSADCATSALYFAKESDYSKIGHELECRFLVFRADGRTHVSSDWSDELFV